jgi:RimJ/RimL family protein N-acetyltransferase
MIGRLMSATIEHKRNDGPLQIEIGHLRNEEEAVKFFVQHLNDNRIGHYLSALPSSLTETSEREYLRKVADDEMCINWFIYAEGNLAGSIGLHRIDRSARNAEAGILLADRDYWGRGVSEAAFYLLLEFSFSNIVAEGLHKIYARICGANIASRTIARRIGLREIGIKKEEWWKGGRWYDEWNGEILKSEWLEKREEIRNRIGLVEYKIYPGCEELHLE